MSQQRKEYEAHARDFLKHYSKEPISDLAATVGAMLHEWQGLHHFDMRELKRGVWTNDYHVRVAFDKSGCGGHLATYDFNDLTRLVFLAHDYGLRVHITPVMNRLEMLFHQRRTRAGQMNEQHPTIENALATWRKSNQSHDLDAIFASPAASEGGPGA